MSTNQPGVGEAASRTYIITGADLGNSKKFIDSLVVFLNEAENYMREVKQKAGKSPGCNSLVSMNDEEKDETLSTIINTLTKSYSESSKKDGQCPDDCEALAQIQGSSSFRQTTKGRAGTPRPGTSPVRGQVASPDQFFIPVAASTMDSTKMSQQACANYPRSLRSPDQVTPSRNVPARRKRYPETTNSTLVPRRYPPNARNQTYQVEGASCDPSCVTLQGSDMGASPGHTPKRYLPTVVPRAPAPKRYLPPRNVGDGGHQVNRRICDPDCDASASEASVKY